MAPVVAPTQTDIDDRHLRWLRLGFATCAAFNVLVASPLAYVFYDGRLPMRLFCGHCSPSSPLASFFRVLAIAIGLSVLVSTLLKLLAFIRLAQLRSRNLCMVAAALGLYEGITGMLLGIAAFAVLSRASVRARFRD